MNLHKLFLLENACYKASRTIKPVGIMLHSTGANNPYLKRYIGPDDGMLGKNQHNNHWNQDRPDGRPVCVHGFIGKLQDGSVEAYQTLPWNHRGWHAGGTANDTHIGIEICEDGLKDAAYFNRVYAETVELCVYLCKVYELDCDNIICHSEGHSLGIASNHADVMHWFPKHGKSMEDFRAAVKKRLAEGDGLTKADRFYRVREAWEDAKSQKGAFKDLANAKRCADEHLGHSVYDENGKPVYSGKRPEAYDIYTVAKGDSLWKIAAIKMGRGNRYPEIMRINELTTSSIFPGQKLKIPK